MNHWLKKHITKTCEFTWKTGSHPLTTDPLFHLYSKNKFLGFVGWATETNSYVASACEEVSANLAYTHFVSNDLTDLKSAQESLQDWWIERGI